MLYLLDASAVLNDFGFQFSGQHSYIVTNLVLQEFRDFRSRHLANNAIAHGLLQVSDPGQFFLEKAESVAHNLQLYGLSEADLSIFGLCLEMHAGNTQFTLVTDDHALQRMCMFMGFDFESIIRGKARPKSMHKRHSKPSKLHKKAKTSKKH